MAKGKQKRVTDYYKKKKSAPRNTNSRWMNTGRAIGRAIGNRISQSFRTRYRQQLKYRYNSPRYKNPVANGYGKTYGVYSKRIQDPTLPALYKKMSALTTYESIDTGAGVSVVGNQGVQMVGTWYTGRSGLTSAGDSQMLLSDQFNDAQKQDTGAGLGYGSGRNWVADQDSQSYKLYLEKFIHELTITNQSQVDAKVELRYVFSKVSAADQNNPVIEWTNAYDNENQGISSNVKKQNFVGARCTDLKNFNMRWKTFHVEQLMMPAGYTHEHKQQVNYKRIIDMMYAQNFNVIRGISICCFLVWSGQPVDDGSTSKVTFAPIKLIWTSRYRATCRFVHHSNKSIRQVDNQEGALTALKFVDDMAGVVGDLLTTDPDA